MNEGFVDMLPYAAGNTLAVHCAFLFGSMIVIGGFASNEGVHSQQNFTALEENCASYNVNIVRGDLSSADSWVGISQDFTQAGCLQSAVVALHIAARQAIVHCGTAHVPI